MTTPNVTELTSARRSGRGDGHPSYAPPPAHWGNLSPHPEHWGPVGDAYRSRCAELRELDRRADIARATS